MTQVVTLVGDSCNTRKARQTGPLEGRGRLLPPSLLRSSPHSLLRSFPHSLPTHPLRSPSADSAAVRPPSSDVSATLPPHPRSACRSHHLRRAPSRPPYNSCSHPAACRQCADR